MTFPTGAEDAVVPGSSYGRHIQAVLRRPSQLQAMEQSLKETYKSVLSDYTVKVQIDMINK